MSNTVYIAACLADRHPDVYFDLKKVLGTAGVKLVEVSGTGNIWIRDYWPINGVQFAYVHDFEKYPQLKFPPFPDTKKWSGIILDGGNVVRSPDGRRVIMTEQTAHDNCWACWGARDGRVGDLEKLLEAEIIWIPSEPGDTLGHSDGIVHWIDDKTVFLNDYRSMHNVAFQDYEHETRKLLRRAGVEAVTFPWAYDECREVTEERFRREHPQADDFNMATGYYINFFKLDNLILYPTFGLDRDNRAADALIDAWPNATIAGIDCSYLAEEGGLLHCVTWEG